MRGFAASPSPEIENADLTGLALDLARWGAKTPSDLRWLNPPREAQWKQAQAKLIAGGALTSGAELTPLGRRIGDMPLPPRLAMMVLQAASTGHAQLASEIAAIMSERELGGRSSDLDDRLRRFRNDSGPRARAMRELAQRWTQPPAARQQARPPAAQPFSHAPSPNASPAHADRRRAASCLQADAARCSTKPIRSPAPNGWRSPT